MKEFFYNTIYTRLRYDLNMSAVNADPCRFYARGDCRKGISCEFSHSVNPQKPTSLSPEDNHSLVLRSIGAPTATVCSFFQRGVCKRGESCHFRHPTVVFKSPPVPAIIASTRPTDSPVHDNNDSRAKVLCKYQSHAGGCSRSKCSYFHHESFIDFAETQTLEDGPDVDEVSGLFCALLNRKADTLYKADDDGHRQLAGACIVFDEYGRVTRVDFDTDFSRAMISGFEIGTAEPTVRDILRRLDLESDLSNAHISVRTKSKETTALVKVRAPSFAEELSNKLSHHDLDLKVVPISTASGQVSSRKLYISWHRESKTVWMNFGREEIAARVANKFRSGRYKILGQSVSASEAKLTSEGQAAWTIILSNVPAHASRVDVQVDMTTSDFPRNIEMGRANHEASDADMSVLLRDELEKRGQLESFHLAPQTSGKRSKATAWFHNDSDARAACSLNNTNYSILGKGKINVQLVYSVKAKLPTATYYALKDEIDELSIEWASQYLSFRKYSDGAQRFMTIKIEGTSILDLTTARKSLSAITSGEVLAIDGIPVWSTQSSMSSRDCTSIKALAAELRVVIQTDRSACELRYFGPERILRETAQRVALLLEVSAAEICKIKLNQQQFSSMLHGGFKSIESTVGKGVVVLDVVSRQITVNGSERQRRIVAAIVGGQIPSNITGILNSGSGDAHDNCPICFCEPEDAVRASCGHTFCAECFEDNCKSAATTSKGDDFQIKCPGDEGQCAKAIALEEIKLHLSPSVYERVLRSSFAEYIKQHPQDFRYCPTADCGYIYRCAEKPPTSLHRCVNCLEEICTSCHARHGSYTCAEYKDIQSGGHEATERLKKELNIKDCPTCGTPMEKTEGCNHMTCGGCRAHICWVCMQVFKASRPCYDHMIEAHGSIGLDHLAALGD